MWEARHAPGSTATPAAVGALWASPERWAYSNADIASAELEGPFERGGAARIKVEISSRLYIDGKVASS